MWAMIPGSGPADIDPWKHMSSAAEAGQQSGVRVAWGIAALIAGTSGRDQELKNVLISHGESIADTPKSESHTFFDQYGYEIALHQSDLLWVSQKGHRTPVLGEMPALGAEPPVPTEDLFGEDPFGE